MLTKTSITRSVFIVFVLVFATQLNAQRPRYTTTERTLDVNVPGVDCAANPGSCFKVHYVVSTPDAPSLTDGDVNGIPDYVDLVARVLPEVYRKEVQEMGWPAPPSDTISVTSGGDGRHDVYITNFGCGRIATVPSEGATSPGGRSFYSFTILHKDMKTCYDTMPAGPGEIRSLTQLQVIQDVIAHEYHHAIEAGMNASATLAIAEGTANWMNDEAYDELNVNVRSEALGQHTLFHTPGSSLYSDITYGNWFWLRYLSERFGHGIVRRIWDNLATGSSNEFTETDNALRAYGTTLSDAFVDFSAKLYAKQWFREGSTYPDVRIENAASPHMTYPAASGTATLNHLSRTYRRFNPPATAASRSLRIAMNGPDLQPAGGSVIADTADGRRVDRQIPLNSTRDGNAVVTGFASSAPPSEAYLRSTSAVLVMSNASSTADSQRFSYCSPDCGLATGGDAAITPWGADAGYREPLWQTVDVWVDNNGNCRPNDPGRPGCNEPAAAGVPAEPSRGRMNRLFARVRNLGNAPLSATVRFRYAPFNTGIAPGIWATIGTSAPVMLAPLGDPSGNDVRVVEINWNLSDLTFNNAGAWDIPTTTATETIANFDHFCVRIEVDAAGDTNLANNVAQNNFGEIPLDSSMRTLTFLIGNPDPQQPGEARLAVDSRLPAGWALVFKGVNPGAVMKLKPGELRMAWVFVRRPAKVTLPKENLYASVSVTVNGRRAGGFSLLLARGTSNAPLGPASTSGVPGATSTPGDSNPAEEKPVNDTLLVELRPRPGVDFKQIDPLIRVYDHYFEGAKDQREVVFIGGVTSESLRSLSGYASSVKVLDQLSGRRYYWLSRAHEGLTSITKVGGRVVGVRPDQTTALVSFDHEISLAEYASVPGKLVQMSLRPIPASQLSPSVLQGLATGILRPIRLFATPDPAIEDLVRNIGTGGCIETLNQFTGEAPITSGGSSFRITSRLSSGPDMPNILRWLSAELSAAGLAVRIESFYSPSHRRELQQLVATLPGNGLAHEAVILTGHLDAVARSQGANDNASGVTAMLCAAKQLSRRSFERTIEFVFFNAEEQGLEGSTAYAQHLADTRRYLVCGVINLDMVAHDRDGDRRIQLQTNGTPGSNVLAAKVQEAVRSYRIDLQPVKVTDGELSSDYAAFWRLGIPAINVGDEYFLCDGDCTDPPRRGVTPPAGDFDPCYHSSCDVTRREGLRPELMMEAGKAVLAAAAELAVLVR